MSHDKPNAPMIGQEFLGRLLADGLAQYLDSEDKQPSRYYHSIAQAASAAVRNADTISRRLKDSESVLGRQEAALYAQAMASALFDTLRVVLVDDRLKQLESVPEETRQSLYQTIVDTVLETMERYDQSVIENVQHNRQLGIAADDKALTKIDHESIEKWLLENPVEIKSND